MYIVYASTFQHLQWYCNNKRKSPVDKYFKLSSYCIRFCLNIYFIYIIMFIVQNLLLHNFTLFLLVTTKVVAMKKIFQGNEQIFGILWSRFHYKTLFRWRDLVCMLLVGWRVNKFNDWYEIQRYTFLDAGE